MATTDQQFTDGFNEASGLHEEDRLGECIEKARTLLDDTAIPHPYQIKT